MEGGDDQDFSKLKLEAWMPRTEATLKRIREKRLLVQHYKESRACENCGVYYPYYIMELHHPDPSHKSHSINELVKNASVERLQQELDSCILLDAHCHRSLHHANGAWKKRHLTNAKPSAILPT